MLDFLAWPAHQSGLTTWRNLQGFGELAGYLDGQWPCSAESIAHQKKRNKHANVWQRKLVPSVAFRDFCPGYCEALQSAQCAQACNMHWKIGRQAFLAQPTSFWACTVYYRLLNTLFDWRLSFLPKHLPLFCSPSLESSVFNTSCWPHIQRPSICRNVFQGLCAKASIFKNGTVLFQIPWIFAYNTLQEPVSQRIDEKWHPQSCPVPSTASVKASRQCPASSNL